MGAYRQDLLTVWQVDAACTLLIHVHAWELVSAFNQCLHMQIAIATCMVGVVYITCIRSAHEVYFIGAL